jgi:hypothetical protein
MAIHLRRSFLRYRPSVSRSGRGVAEESLTRLRAASRSHEPRQQVGTPRVAITDPKTGSQWSASGDNWGRLPIGCSAKVLLAGARPGSAPGLEGGGKGALSCHNTSILPSSAGTQTESQGRAEVLIPFELEQYDIFVQYS